MKDLKYDALICELVRRLTRQAARLGNPEIAASAKNRISGQSGYAHQIDVSVRRPGDLLLIEAKLWSRRVDVGPVMILAGRVADIQENEPNTRVWGSIVSTKQATRGAVQLAKHLGISLQLVKNESEYAVRVFDHWFAGFVDSLSVSSELLGGSLITVLPEESPPSPAE